MTMRAERPELLTCQSHSLGVIAGAGGDNAAGALLV